MPQVTFGLKGEHMSAKKTKHVLLTTGKSGFSELTLTMNLFVMDVCSSAPVQPLVAYTTANESPEPDRAPKVLVESAPKPLEASKSKESLTAHARTRPATNTILTKWRFDSSVRSQLERTAARWSYELEQAVTVSSLLRVLAAWLVTEQPVLLAEPAHSNKQVSISVTLSTQEHQQLLNFTRLSSMKLEKRRSLNAMCRAGMAEMLTRLDTMEPVPLEALVEALCEHPRAKKKKRERSLESTHSVRIFAF